jgi:hypothetical protein
MIEASPSAYRSGMLALGTRRYAEEETFYVAGDVKPSLSSLRAEAISPLENTKRPLRGCDCAEGSRMREAHQPQTTFYPCRYLPSEHLI